MTRSRFWAAALGLLLTASPAQGQQKPVDLEVQFKAAERREQVDGDLKGAIEQYRQIVAQSGANRTIAAKALLRMAECYQKQGDVEARKIYERLLREYPDQRETVTLAQARFGSTTTASRGASVSLRKARAGDVLGTVSPDGRYLSFIDWTAGNLMVHDFTTGVDRALTGDGSGTWPASGEFAEESAISRDGSQVAFAWYDAPNRRYDLRLTSLKGSGVPSIRRLFASEDVLWIVPYDWSPDGKWIAVSVQRKEQIAQLGLVSVADGALRVLKSVDWRGPTKVFFSHDGRFVGYDLPSPGVRQRDVYVLSVDGSREINAVVHQSHDVMMGWSPDGKQLLFASDRNGTTGLWALPFDDGKVQGSPAVLHPNIGSTMSMGLTTNGALYLGVSADRQDIQVASLDLNTGKRLSQPVRPIGTFMGSNRDPSWSPDGRYLAYRSTRGLSAAGRDVVVGVLSLETGEVRDVVPQGLLSFNHLSWAPDGRSFAVAGTDLKGLQGVYRVDAQSGAAVPITATSANLFVGQRPQWAPNGKHIVYRRRSDAAMAIVERDVNTGVEREMLAEAPRGNAGFSISPDGQWLAVITTDQATRASRCMLVPIAGGPAREIYRVDRPQTLQANLVGWSPDGRGVIVRHLATAGNDSSASLRLIPVSGEAPRTLDVDVRDLVSTQLHVHPDGKRLAFTTGRPSTEVWVLENFLPAPKGKP